MTTLRSRKSIDSSPLRRGLRFGAFALILACFAFPSTSRAVTPAPDGGYFNDNTAEGANALDNLDLTTGTFNTAIGSSALRFNISGQSNTAVGGIPPMITPPLAPRPSLSIKTVTTTRLPDSKRFITTLPATTQPTAPSRSIATRAAETTRPTV
jgi:hypothetical protein